MAENTETATPKPKKKGGFNLKYVLIGVPVFIVQVVIIYFVTANILMKKMESSIQKMADTTFIINEKVQNEEEKNKEESEAGGHLLPLEDIIINPAGTSGQRLLLTTVGLDIENEEQHKAMKEKEIVVKDLIISTLTKKSLAELSQVGFKDTLKVELMKQIEEKFKSVKVNNIYFSKYIIQ